MWHIKVFGFIYLTAVCAAQDPKDAVTSMIEDLYSMTPLITAAPTAQELPEPHLQQRFPWLDVFPSEKVGFNCSIAGSSDWTFIWYRDQLQVQDSDPNVSLADEGSVLTIIAETQNYSGSYSCKGKHKTKGDTTAASNSLLLTVYENQPKPTIRRSPSFDKMFPGESVTFTCTLDGSMFSGWEYLLYHNGKEISTSNHSTFATMSVENTDSGQYHCRAKRASGFYTEESKQTTLWVSEPPKPSLKVLTPWLDVFENETVEFSCEAEIPDWTFTWYKNGERLEEKEDLILADDGSLLNITSVTQTHQGNYSCRAHYRSRRVVSGFSNTTHLKVYENVPKPTLHKNPDFSQMYVGETVNFTCNVDVSSGWEYQFLKDGEFLDKKFTRETVSIRLGPSDAGIYLCKATRYQTSTEFSEKIQQVVHEVPAPSLKLSTQWADVFPAESVKLSCRISGSSGWIYTWYRDGQEPQADSLLSFDANGANLSISSTSDVHAGQYNCKGHLKGRSVSTNSSSGLILTVYDDKPSVILKQYPEYNVMFPGESVSFSCHINVSLGWKYLWYKDGNPLGISGDKYTISLLGTTNRGSYTCKAKRGTDQVFHTTLSEIKHLQVEENKPKPLMTQKPEADKVYAGESVSFECKVKLSSGWRYLWFKDGAQHHNGSTFKITNAILSDNGTYECMAIRDRAMYTTERSDQRILHVSEIPVPTSELITQWSDVFPTESVELRCGMDGSSDWTYTWYKDGVAVVAGGTASYGLNENTLSISSASASHRGQYSCSGKLKSRLVNSSRSSGLTLIVYDAKPRVTLMQNSTHNVMHTGDSVSFNCHINVSSGWEYLWYKDGSKLIETSDNHTIASAVTTNTGSYTCQVKRGRKAVFHSDQSQAVKLNIIERPKASIILLTGWSEVFSTDSLVLKCGVQESQDMWNYTWFKEDQSINETHGEKHIVTPENDPKQSLYTCRGIRTSRPYHSKRSDSFNTKNLLLKRRVLLSISGCIFFGIIAVFLGCIILRVFHKPADDEEKPEEAELFLSMSIRKSSTDAPCPVVQYITDAALNATSKEDNENGTICSETTPLPITSQDDQAVTTESHDTMESNGGLVSFKQ